MMPSWMMGICERRAWQRAWAPLGIFGLILAGCATVQKTEFPELVWPDPPEKARIKFVRLLSKTSDVGRSAGELFAEALLGPKRAPESLNQPVGVAPSRDGKRLYVTDYGRGAVFVFHFDGGGPRFLEDPFHPFRRPFGVTVDDKDNVYIVDSVLKLVRVFDARGKFLRNISHESLTRPTGIAIDPIQRHVYVVDSSRKDLDNHVVHVFNTDGTYVKAFGGKGREDGKFFFPTYIAVDGQGKLYVTDTLNARVQVFDAEGRHLRSFGRRGDNVGMFGMPKGVAVDSFGNVYLVDSAWSNVQVFNQRAELLLFFGGRGYFPGLLYNPTGIAIDKDNRIYVADTFNGRVAIYQLINTKAEDAFASAAPQPEKLGDQAKKGGDPAKVRNGQNVEKPLTEPVRDVKK